MQPSTSMLDLMSTLSDSIGERFSGTPSEHEAAHAILSAFREVVPDAYLDEINFTGWSIQQQPTVVISQDGEDRTVSSAPIIYSGSTPPGGVEGTLEPWGKKILIEGLYEPPIYALKQQNRVVAQVLIAPSDDAIAILNPDPIFVLPTVAVGGEDKGLIDEAVAKKSIVSVDIQGSLVPDAVSYNVVAEYRGNPASSRRGVVVAHYDTQLNTPGYYDNASGVGAMLDLLQYVTGSGLPINVDFVAVAGEEVGMIGSRFHAQRVRERGELPNIAYCLCLDQISAGKDLQIWASNEAREITDSVVTKALEQFPADYEILEPMAGSDMWTLHTLGVPGVMLMWWRLAEYHRPGDTSEFLEREKLVWTAETARTMLTTLDETFI